MDNNGLGIKRLTTLLQSLKEYELTLFEFADRIGELGSALDAKSLMENLDKVQQKIVARRIWVLANSMASQSMETGVISITPQEDRVRYAEAWHQLFEYLRGTGNHQLIADAMADGGGGATS